MVLEGTVRHGQVVFPGVPTLPEGYFVKAEFTSPDDDLDAELDDMPPPPQTETYEEHLAVLRQSIAKAKAGELVYTVNEVMARVTAAIEAVVAEKNRKAFARMVCTAAPGQ